MNTTQEHHNAQRDLAAAERAYNRGEIDSITLNEARQRAHEAAKRHDEERAALLHTIQNTKIPEEKTSRREELTELQRVKRQLKTQRALIKQLRAEQHTLKTQLATTKHNLHAIREEYKSTQAQRRALAGKP